MAVKKRSADEQAEILQEARKRFKHCEDWEGAARSKFVNDIKFDAADSLNLWQWPQSVQDRLSTQNKVMLTINRVRQHNLDILNDARQSQISIKIRPVRETTFEAAQLLEGVIKHIEYISNADQAYQHALAFAVRGGIGWVRIVTDYMSDDSFDQEIFIRRVPDPLSVYLDPDISEFDGSDSRFGFVFTDMPRDQFDKAYPKFKDHAANADLGSGESWVTDDKVRVAEYFRCIQDEDRLVVYTDPQSGQQITGKESEIDKALMKTVIDDPDTMVRSIMLTKVEHFMIIGDQIAEEKEWPGRYIPLLRCIGEETVIEGQMDRKGHTRALLDQQRMANYSASASIEYGALQNKIPYITPLAAVEGVEEYWKNANTENYAYLPFKHIDDEGNPIPKPERQQPPMQASLFASQFETSIQQMYLASGQNQADFGMPSNERSGVAINARQRQGDNATYHYLAHQAAMIRNAGKQLIDLIPKVYDTPRLVKFRDEAGQESDIQIDPNAPQPMQKAKTGPDSEMAILNPKLGTYDVQADVGAAYQTRRQEAFEAYTQILTQNKELTGLIGDIALRFADFPGAEEAAIRLRRMVPKQALEDGPSPDVVKLQQQIQAMQNLVGELNDKLASKEADHVNDQEKNAVAGYDAQTRRLSALKDALAVDPGDLLTLVREVLTSAIQTEGTALAPALDTTAAGQPVGPGQDAALAQGSPLPTPQEPQGGPSAIPAPGGPQPVPGPSGGPPAEQAMPGGPPPG